MTTEYGISSNHACGQDIEDEAKNFIESKRKI